jgi:hypothetical protein
MRTAFILICGVMLALPEWSISSRGNTTSGIQSRQQSAHGKIGPTAKKKKHEALTLDARMR